MAMGLSFGTISLIGGYIAATAGYRSLFLLGMVMSASGFVLLWGMQKWSVTPFYGARLAERQG
ncbi:MAG: hypothetical protein HC802_09325 [Caldilineaceae bacterium]|nr:hypothetical protein [Caldilineaceae bacterium]